MNDVFFETKPGKRNLMTDAVFGYPALWEPGKELLNHLGRECIQHGWRLPLVTEFGRLKERQRELYAPQRLYELRLVIDGQKRDPGGWRERFLKALATFNGIPKSTTKAAEDAAMVVVANELALETFSYHCLGLWSKEPPTACAFDLRTELNLGDKILEVYSKAQIQHLQAVAIEWGKKAGIKADPIYHFGTANHLHCELERGRPADWL